MSQQAATLRIAGTNPLLNCLFCKRTMLVWGEVFANGLTDGPTICHSCKEKRNHEAELGMR